MAAAFFPSADGTSHPLHSVAALPLDGSRHPAQFSAREGWFQSYCRPIEFAVERQDGGALLIRTADESILTV